MKKLLYVLAIFFVLATTFTACTDENVKPQTADGTSGGGAGGGGLDPKGGS